MHRRVRLSLKPLFLAAIRRGPPRFSSKVRRQGCISDRATVAMDFSRAGAVETLREAYRAHVQWREEAIVKWGYFKIESYVDNGLSHEPFPKP